MSNVGSLNGGFDVPPDESLSAVARQQGRRQSPRPSLRDTFALIRSDIAFRCAYEKKNLTIATTLRMLTHPGISTVVRYRLQCFFMANGLGFLGRLLKWYNVVVYSVLLDENAEIGGGLCLAHPTCISVMGDVRIGERCIFFHQNTVSSSQFYEPGVDSGPTVVGNDVSFGGGSCAYGAIEIGDGCRIGSNAVVDRSFPAGSLLFGLPARAIGKSKSSVPDPST